MVTVRRTEADDLTKDPENLSGRFHLIPPPPSSLLKAQRKLSLICLVTV